MPGAEEDAQRARLLLPAQSYMGTWCATNLSSKQQVKDDLANTWCWNSQKWGKKPRTYTMIKNKFRWAKDSR